MAGIAKSGHLSKIASLKNDSQNITNMKTTLNIV